MEIERPEFELELALDNFYDGVRDQATLPDSTVPVPVYVVKDAIQRLQRYEKIVIGLTDVGNFLWVENLRKYGERRVHKNETPEGVCEQDFYKRMCMMVRNSPYDEVQMEDAFVELALSMARINGGDPSGLGQYLEKEDQLFEELEEWD